MTPSARTIISNERPRPNWDKFITMESFSTDYSWPATNENGVSHGTWLISAQFNSDMDKYKYKYFFRSYNTV